MWTFRAVGFPPTNRLLCQRAGPPALLPSSILRFQAMPGGLHLLHDRDVSLARNSPFVVGSGVWEVWDGARSGNHRLDRDHPEDDELFQRAAPGTAKRAKRLM